MDKINITFKKKNGEIFDPKMTDSFIFGLNKNKLKTLLIILSHPKSIPYLINSILHKNNIIEMEKFYKNIGINFNEYEYMIFTIGETEYKLAIYKNDFFANISHLKELYSMDVENKYDVMSPMEQIIVDGGANIGTFALFCAKHGAKKVYAFEPIQIVYDNLKENIVLNGFEKCIIPIKKALGDKKEDVFISFNEHSDMSASIGFEDNIHSKERIQIVPLDSVVSGRVDFIKLDIEGYENEALKGSKNILKTFEPTLSICAYHKIDDKEQIPKTINAINKNYKCNLQFNSEWHIQGDVEK